MAETAAIRRVRIILWILVTLAAIAATVLFVLRPPADPRAPGISYAEQPFTLSSTTGRQFSNADLKGLPTLLFFGYTFCPDVCPTTISDTLKWRSDLGIGYDTLRTIFVTIDPERDTVDILKSYVGAFDPGIEGLVGTAAETDTVRSIFGVVAEKGEDDGSGFYLVNHTATLFLIGADGSYQGTVAYGEETASAEAKIKRLVNG
ncbi:MAG TPA: SCO family protein [Devosia sp.]|nr:SCO family protein [Devosia sp.]